MKKTKLKLRNIKENKIIWSKIRCYIDFVILACCMVIAFNISSNINVENDIQEKTTMKYVFHDYDGNTYVLNDTVHGTTRSLDYLFKDEVPDSIKDGTKNWQWSASLADATKNKEMTPDNENTVAENNENIVVNDNMDDNVKDNQITIDEIIQELWVEELSGDLVIDFNDLISDTGNNQGSYTVTENSGWTVIIITKNNWENIDEKNIVEDENIVEDSDLYLTWKVFTYVIDGYVQPILIPRDQLAFNKDNKTITYIDDSGEAVNTIENNWVTIIDEYADCMTPWWYTIQHWDSVLAYQQRNDAPDICNIERRFCWNWKLSGTYRQQWCSVNTNYTYAQRWETAIAEKPSGPTPDVVQNPDWSVTVNDDEIWSSFVFDRPNPRGTTGYYWPNNIVTDEEVDQTTRPHRGCTTPWWEKVKHWQIVQAFKHGNGFSDSPCEAQLRLCTMWDLMWSYTQPNCKTRDTSFIDRINGSPTWETYSKEKLQWVKDLIEAEENYDIDYYRQTYSDQLDHILSILDN